MAIDTRVQPLLRVDLFQGLKPLQLTEIARRADRIIYRPGEVMIREREQGDAAVLIVSGDAVRVRGPQMSTPAEPVPAGALLGEMAMLIETEHTSTVVARTAVRALRISRQEILQQMADDPALAHHFADRINGRLKSLVEEFRKLDAIFTTEPGSKLASHHAAAQRSPGQAPAAVYH